MALVVGGPAIVLVPPGKRQGAGGVPESGLRQVLRGSCPMGVKCECARMNTQRTLANFTWQNQRIIAAFLEKGTVPVFLEREAPMKQSSAKCWKGRALEEGCLEGRSVAEVFPTLTGANAAGDCNFTTKVSAFTYKSDMNAQLNLGNQCAVLFCRARYGSLGAKCSQLSAVSLEDFASAVRAQETWGEGYESR
eukprot:794976-Rhodomonas_salina.1